VKERSSYAYRRLELGQGKKTREAEGLQATILNKSTKDSGILKGRDHGQGGGVMGVGEELGEGEDQYRLN